MSHPILLLSRSWHGRGGMQQLSHDLARELKIVYGDRVLVCHPSRKGLMSMVSFLFRVLFLSVKLRGKKAYESFVTTASLPLTEAIMVNE